MVITNIKAENIQNTCAFDRKEQLTSLWYIVNSKVEVHLIRKSEEINEGVKNDFKHRFK